MKISVFGLGYVGTVSAACLAELGHTVIGVDVQEDKVAAIQEGRCLLTEPILEELVRDLSRRGRLTATLDAIQAVENSDLSLISVGTPSTGTGSIQMDHITTVCHQIGKGLARKRSRHVVAIRSTILPGAVKELVIPALECASGRMSHKDFGVCTLPEFLREGSAVPDFRNPPMIVIGETDAKDGDLVAACFDGMPVPIFRCAPDEAMMIKYASNLFHAAKIVFANEIGSLCQLLGLDSHRIMDIFCKDTQLNLSSRYLKPGFAFGGSCLAKDLRAIIALGQEHHFDTPMLASLIPSNRRHIERAVTMILELDRKRIGVLGLSFKDQTDDLRESPAIEVIEQLLGKGCDIAVHDSDVHVSQIFGANLSTVETRLPHIASLLRDNLEMVLEHADIIVVAKGSPIYKRLPSMLREDQRVVDLVRLFKPGELPAAQYYSSCG